MHVMKLTILILTFLLIGSESSQADELVTLQTRPDVDQKFILLTHAKPVASVILFPGGKGTLNLSSVHGVPTINWGENNFLVRTRDMFTKNGFMVSVIDAPSDHQSRKGMFGGFRDSEDHVTDIDHVISALRKRADVPVWLVGTSRGTESAASIAIYSKQKPDGLILTSSISISNFKGTAVTKMALEKIRIPTLIVAHTNDSCDKTPPEGAQEIADMLRSRIF